VFGNESPLIDEVDDQLGAVVGSRQKREMADFTEAD